MWKKKNIDQKYLDILHTWDSSTKMQLINHLNFQTIYLQLKAKGGRWLHSLMSTDQKFVIHIPSIGIQTQTKWHTSRFYGSQTCQTPQKCNYGINSVLGENLTHWVWTQVTWGPCYLTISPPYQCCVQHI